MLPLVLPFPDISPELFSIDLGGFVFALRWYALSYIAGILIGWRLALATLRRDRLWPGGRALRVLRRTKPAWGRVWKRYTFGSVEKVPLGELGLGGT